MRDIATTYGKTYLQQSPTFRQYAFRYNILMMKLQSTRFEVLSGRVLSCALGRKPYRCVWLTEGGSSGCSTCIGIFKTLLKRSTIIEVHILSKSGRSGEQYPFLSCKCSKYTELSSTHEFQPVSVESHRPRTERHHSFFPRRTGPQNHKPFRRTVKGRRVTTFQRYFNSRNVPRWRHRHVAIPTCFYVFNIFAFNTRDPYYRGYLKNNNNN